MGVYADIFGSRGLEFSSDSQSIKFKGPLPAGEYELRGDVSSQFISGLLFALPLLKDDSVIKIIPPFESRSYVELTLIAMKEFGVIAEFTDSLTIKIRGNQKYKSRDISVEADYSAAAFLEALNTLENDIEVRGLLQTSAQGDRVYRDIFPLIKNGAPTVDIKNCPDLGPILFALAAYFNGAEFIGTERLRIKESDRCETMAEELRKFGADIEIYENRVVIKKTTLKKPTLPILAHNDHRVVMSAAVLLTLFGGEIEGAEAVSKSYPNFFSDIASLGAKVTFYD
jgi:3-phosphoshikimate 1-carboxyvinyltransferase